MCGIAGMFDPSASADEGALLADAGRMASTLMHRGPDDAGAWADPAAGIALGFRRLAILDLSPEGHQPMHSASGRFVLAFNGEIYNFADLRAELEGNARFRGHSDTEIMLAAFERWGVEASLRRFVGMYGFAAWDRRERRLYLARDRMGEKPLYYGWSNGRFLFGSELKALAAHPAFDGAIDRGALALYFRHGYVPAPHSIYRGIRKLRPGTFLVLDDPTPGRLPEPVAYWSARQAAEAGAADPLNVPDADAIDATEAILRRAVAGQMVADVPVGAFLSGGVDSSTIVALMQAQSTRPVRTFTIGFDEPGYDEAGHARAVARHLGTDHTELYVTPAESRDLIPRLPHIYDEPFADSSAIPTCLVSRLARQAVTVSLSGDGGDELFAGYLWYAGTRRLHDRLAPLPRPFRSLAGGALGALPPGAWDGLLRLVPSRLRPGASGYRLHKLAALLAEAGTPERMHRLLGSKWNAFDGALLDPAEPPTAFTDPAAWANVSDPIARLQCLDQQTYLPDDILVKVDRASMAVSLEARAPFLDHRLVEHAWRLPPACKQREGVTRWVTRQILYRHVPRELIDRPKMGFSVPIAAWLRRELRPWAESLLAEDRLRSEGFLNPAVIRARWQEHQDSRRDWSEPLWIALMFQAWLDARHDREPAPIDLAEAAGSVR